jgi:O-antigen ligase
VQGRITVGPAPWRWAVLLYGAVLALSITQASDFVLSLKEMLKWGELLFAYLVGVTLIRTKEDLRRLLVVLFVAVLAESAVGLLQTILHAGPASFGRGAFLRASGTFDQPNPYAGYLNMCFPLAVACLVYRVFPRRAMWFVVFVTGGGVLASLSRGGELASICALLVMAALISPLARVFIGLGAVSLTAALAGVVVGLVPSSLSDAIGTGLGISGVDVVNPTPVTWAVAERLAHMEAGLAMWADHPILGVGIGNYPAQYDKYKVAPVWQNALSHAHNYYINIGAEAGIIGLVAFLLLIGSALLIGIRGFRRATDPLSRAVALGATGVMVGIAVHSFFDDVFVHGMEVQMALVMVAASRVYAGFVASAPEEQGT